MKAIEFRVALDGFVTCQSCIVSTDTVGRLQMMTLEDSNQRPLKLSVSCEPVGGTAIKVSNYSTPHSVQVCMVLDAGTLHGGWY